jgi:hypothetical protein
VTWLRKAWFWLTHARCYGCRELTIPSYPRRPCIYCRKCMPEFWP